MKTKAITIIITILILVVPIVILPNDVNLLKAIMLISGGAALLVLFLMNYKRIKIDKKDVLIIIFAMLIFISTMLSSDIHTSIFGTEKRYEGMLILFTYIIIYLCTKKFFEYKNKKILLIILYILYILVCTLGVIQQYVKIPEINLLKKGVAGTFGNTNFMGNFLSIGIPIFSMMYIMKNKKLSFITSMLIFFCIIACGARSSWVAFLTFVTILIAYLIQTKNKEYIKRTVIIFVGFALIFTYLFTAKNSFAKSKIKVAKKDITVAATQGIKSNMGSGRIQIWKITVDLIEKYPLLGVGTDNLKKGIRDNLTDESIDFMLRTRQQIDKAHNEYLQYAVTLGIPALLIYIAFILCMLKDNIKDIETNDEKLILYLIIISYLVQANFNISTIGVAPLFWFSLGLLDSKENSTNQQKTS